jgi:sugar phosphate permease
MIVVPAKAGTTAEKVPRLTLPRIHYAFIVAGVTFMVLLIGAGMRAVPGVFVVPFETEFGWSRATISLAVGVCIGLYGLTAPFSAAIMDRFGVRGTMLGALTSIGIALALLPLMTKSWHLIALWGVMIGLGIGFVANVLAAIVATRWFVARRGVVMGVLTSATAAGQLLFLPPLAIIAATFGWRAMAMTLAVAVVALIPLVFFLMRDRPEDLGLKAYGETGDSKPPERTTGNPIRNAFAALRFGLGKRDFYLLAGTFFVCGASTNGLIGTHLVPACIDNGIPEIMAASLLASMAIFNFIGATGSGYLSDRVDCRILLCVYYGLRGLSLLFLPFSFDTFYTLSLFAVFYGLDWIATIPPTVKLIGQSFGREKTAVMYGWITCCHQLGGASAAFFGGVLRVNFDTYMHAFMISGLMCLIAAIMALFIGYNRPAPVQPVTAAA